MTEKKEQEEFLRVVSEFMQDTNHWSRTNHMAFLTPKGRKKYEEKLKEEKWIGYKDWIASEDYRKKKIEELAPGLNILVEILKQFKDII